MRISINQEVPAYTSYAAERTRGMYNVAAGRHRRFHSDACRQRAYRAKQKKPTPNMAAWIRALRES